MEYNALPLIEKAVWLCSKQQYKDALELLEHENDEAAVSPKIQQLKTACFLKLGDFENAYQLSKIAAESPEASDQIKTIHKEASLEFHELQKGFDDIAGGKHNSESIEKVKVNTELLIQNRCYASAVFQLRKLAIARKVKTTNILWIGNILRDLYFLPDAEKDRSHFDRVCLSEITFYYLKTCKLAEPEYKVIQEAMKNTPKNTE